MSPLRVSLVEPYDAGSHRSFREAWAARSAHRIRAFTLPGRKWKWRMRSAAIHLQPQRREILDADVVVASGFLNLAEFQGLAATGPGGAARPPCVLIMHENHLTYPVQVEDERDYHYTFTNIVSCLAADAVWFNSAFHRESFLAAIPAFLKRMPEALPFDVPAAIAGRSRVMHLGVASPLETLSGGIPAPDPGRPLRIGWNHRWEFDKQPERFFAALDALHGTGAPFELVVLGERFRNAPDVFETARERLKAHVVHWGFARDPAEYARHLAGCDVVVSTAAHEFFGIAVVEAALCGCGLLVPRRLSYPELFPQAYAGKDGAFYDDEADLVRRLTAWARTPALARERGAELRAEAGRFLWEHRGPALDAALAEVGVRD
jgi:glycosyltransferase involved in cell wall biosynthesis